ncbi:MAG TPA: SRPBCC family protein [Acidimicrobiia bacterium]|nr:SRPBCC family protein [Acidimicrobiia bacterium]
MAVECQGDVGVEASPALCFAAAAELEDWPEWARDLQRVEVVTRNPQGPAERVRMVADLFGREFHAVVDFDLSGAPDVMRFTLVEAPKLTELDGSFRFEPDSEGTRMSYRLRMVLAEPKGARIDRMVSRKVDTALSRDLRRHIERNFARR